MRSISKSLSRTLLASAVSAIALASTWSGAAAAITPAPHWLVMAIPTPTDFHAGDMHDFYEVAAVNDGGTATAGKVTVTDILPKGVTVSSETGYVEAALERYPGSAMECTEGVSKKVTTVTCKTASSVPAGQLLAIKINVEVSTAASGPLTNTVTVLGGGAESTSAMTETPVTPSTQPVPFGARMSSEIVQSSGVPAVQAGSHPWAYTTLLAFNTRSVNAAEKCGAELGPLTHETTGCAVSDGDPRDIEVRLPPGIAGNPTAVPRCSQQKFQSSGYTECPADTQVGVVNLSFFTDLNSSQQVPVYNVEPPPGQPAELGLSVSAIGHVGMFFHLRSGGDYGLTADTSQITQFLPLRALAMTIWGVPADEAHRPLRMSSQPTGCGPGSVDCVTDAPLKPFLTMPTSCPGSPLSLSLGTDSWEDPIAAPLPATSESQLPAITGCEALSLGEPSIEAQPSSHQAGTPSGYDVKLRVPQAEGTESNAISTVRSVEVRMPEGTVISPSAANGLLACSDAQFGERSERVGKCPPQSMIGAVKISSPLLVTPLTGRVYVGQPECSPCSSQQVEEGKMVRLLVEAKLPEPKPEVESPAVLVKLVGHAKVNRTTGRLTTVFDGAEGNGLPQLPFEEVELSLEEGPNAPLVNPVACGEASATAHLTGWSGASAEITSSAVSIEGCSTPGFSPSLAAGMTSSQRGGAFSPFAVTLSRPDGQQAFGSVTMHMPPGLVGMLSKVQLCGEPQANEGTCPAASEIGTTTAVVGPGSQPDTISGGKVYLTGAYGGGSFGLSIVVPAEAGPFHLAGLTGAGQEGNGSVVVRGSIKVDPTTSALTITTNPMPTQLGGIPLDIQRVIVEINKEGFMFNPTDCDATSITGTIDSSTGTAANVSYPFQAVNCAALPFKPGFKVSTKARHTRRFGAYMHVTVTSGSGQANIKSVFVELPQALVARSETLKMACTAAQFAANPAGCPASSHVGTAVARTPVLPVPLTGPAMFVSYGGAKFPDLDVVLQGDGVTIDLAGATEITKKRKLEITSSNFKAVPDVPISTFELTLPEGSSSALSANANLCTKTVTKRVKKRVHGKVVYRKRHVRRRRTLIMPTTITGQNGAVIKQSTKIAVAGCPKLGGKKHKHHSGKRHAGHSNKKRK